MATFREGDMVFHRSNPDFEMVVTFVDEEMIKADPTDRGYTCRWMSTKGELQTERFSAVEILRPL
jgi:hypothetical protein